MLRAKSLSCSMGGSEILREVSFEFSRSDFVSIVGPNGSGKTTLLRCLLGLIPSGDSVFLDGRSMRTYSRKEVARTIGYVPQLVGTLPGYTVEQFVAIGRYAQQSGLFQWTKKEEAAIAFALEATKVSQFRTRKVSSLSGGELQRVLLAAALAQEPRMLLLDEPASFLDPKHEVELYQLLLELHTGCELGVCLVSHDINSACQTSKRIVALREGEIVFDDAPEQFLNSDVLKEIYETSFSVLQTGERSTGYAVVEFDRDVS